MATKMLFVLGGIMNIKFDDLVKVFAEKLENRGVSNSDAILAGTILAQNSADGVYSHGVNRFPRVVSYIDKGYIDPKAKAEKDWATSDALRDALQDAGFVVKDTADGTVWSI